MTRPDERMAAAELIASIEEAWRLDYEYPAGGAELLRDPVGQAAIVKAWERAEAAAANLITSHNDVLAELQGSPAEAEAIRMIDEARIEWWGQPEQRDARGPFPVITGTRGDVARALRLRQAAINAGTARKLGLARVSKAQSVIKKTWRAHKDSLRYAHIFTPRKLVEATDEEIAREHEAAG